MTLLQSISRAAAAAGDDAGSAADDLRLPNAPKFPLVLNAEKSISQLKPEFKTLSGLAPIKRVDGWKVSETDAEIAAFTAQFFEDLKAKLEKRKSLQKGSFLVLLNTFLRRCNERIIGLAVDLRTAEIQFAVEGIEKLGSWFAPEVTGLIAVACVAAEVWEVLTALILQGNPRHLSSFNVVEKLVEKNKSEILCIYVKYVPDLRSSEIVALLKFFLSPSEESYRSMMEIRKIWENQALLAIEKATEAGKSRKKLGLPTEASILLMMAYDGFTSPELCLHYLFGSFEPDGLVFASAVSKLDGYEVLSLVKYLVKWLEKYNRFPEAKPCPLASSKLGLVNCDSVPSLELVVKALGFVLDEHFSYLVLNPEAHEELRRAEEIVESLTIDANLCLPLDSIVKYLRSDNKKE